MLDMRFFENPRFSAASGSAITLVFLALFGTLFLLTPVTCSPCWGYDALPRPGCV